MEYTNLNVKSHYSLLSSTLKINDIVDYAVANQMPYASICDQSYLSGAIAFIESCQAHQITPIIGLDFKLNYHNEIITILAYAQNMAGFKNLEKISSFLIEDTISYDNFQKYEADLVIVIDMNNTNIYQDYLLNNKLDTSSIARYQEIFHHFYYYFSNRKDQEYMQAFYQAYDADQKYVLAIKDVYYQDKEQAITYYLLDCLKQSHEVEMFELRNYEGNAYLLNQSQAKTYFTKKELTNLDTLLQSLEPPEIIKYDTLPLYKKSIEENNKFLQELCLKGLKKRLQGKKVNQKEYLQRLKFELDTVIDMGYANYFLIVYDYVLYAKTHNILVGPGRGSSAGSLIAYCLGITEVDPIANDLIFERFLNPERVSLPDIDVDFQDDKREQIIDYLKEKYGSENIAHIITFGTFQAKNSIRDLGRVLKIPNYQLDKILKLIPNVLNVRLVNLLAESNQLQVVLQTNSDLNFVYQQAIKIEGLIRHISTHAAGIVIANKKVYEYGATLNTQQTLSIQYTMDVLEDLGLYKMDILGLRNLTILSDILNDIDEDINLSKIDLKDPKTLALMSKGETLGIFQFESVGVIKVLQKMKVTSLDDMVATTALFRPGPMQYIDEYIKRKNKIVKYDYIHPDLKDILASTYGIIVYQEQIMQICQKMAGFSYAKADIVRKGMAKKDEKILKDIKEDFINSSIENGYTKKVATKVYDMILLFSNYGFNKAHAYSYALLGYYLAYLKANYPKEFFKNILSANTYNVPKLKEYMQEMKTHHLKIAAPSLNKSTLAFTMDQNSFIMPLTSIKGIGGRNAEEIVAERAKHGPYQNYLDALIRLNQIKINDSIIKALIYAGAFDEFGYNRKTMIENLSSVERYVELNSSADQQNILELDIVKKPRIVKYQDDQQIASKELDYLGLYLNNHPLDKYTETYPDNTLDKITKQNAALVIVDNVREIRTKKGQLMAFVAVSDYLTNKTLVVFPGVYQRYQGIIKVKSILLVKGEQDTKEKTNIIVSDIKKVNSEEG